MTTTWQAKLGERVNDVTRSAAAGFFTTGVTTAFWSESADEPPPFDKWTLVAGAEDETATDGGLRLRG
jgi:hypothetical protein